MPSQRLAGEGRALQHERLHGGYTIRRRDGVGAAGWLWRGVARRCGAARRALTAVTAVTAVTVVTVVKRALTAAIHMRTEVHVTAARAISDSGAVLRSDT